MKEFLEFIVKNIVKQPNEASITEEKSDSGFIYKIKVASEDMGLIIGKEGRTIKSIREMAIARAIKDQTRVTVLLEDDHTIKTEESMPTVEA